MASSLSIPVRWVACAAAAWALSVAAPALADPAPSPPADGAAKPLGETLTGLAKAEYEAGRVLYGDRDYTNAILKFERAYEIARDPRLLWNVAVCEKNLRRYAKMLATIRRYQSEGAAVLTADEKARAVEIVKTVEAFVSGLKLTSNQDGAEVFVDDELVGTTPLAAPVMIDVGLRRIRVKKKGFVDGARTMQVTGGGTVAIDVELEKEAHRGRLLVVAGPSDLISVDGRAVGVAKWEGAVASGGHTLRVTSPGMATFQSEAVVQDQQTRRIEVTLNPLPKADAGRGVFWVIGGAALATGAVVAGALLYKAPQSAAVQGNIAPGSVQLSYRGHFR
jgi:hypothetical protein